ncbi:hypothetical protein J2W22_003052 [Sphingomonas kyeonggiensis]|uniref:hypothetical protein n=1 Tax=Sphingomonas kyeonggiensis TaxID=1268553 RepID=UPI00277F7052|nr:hypothetical protein [Sphingomonas kyeonggiensis]MDQ0250988.1 hypothetical protein [Sphingomonas kyeonggiensis]
MAPSFSIDRQTGNIRIGDTVVLKSGEQRAAVEPQVATLADSSRDHGNGFDWLHLRGLTFGGQPAHLSLCFHDNLLEQASWSVRLPDAETDGGWPTRDAIDAEVAFVHRTLTNEMGIRAGSLPWGEVWSSFDAKGFLAANGLRYYRA